MRPTLALRAFRPTLRMMSPVPRLRKLRQIPPELLPLGTSLLNSEMLCWTRFLTNLGVVVGFAVGAAAYSIGRHLVTDKTIRLKRQGKSAAAHDDEHH
ncbi:hypothetical protein CCHL11_01526 [Colletotrichum chlorophyti]|uniref:Uncharacterized protein n=1 Tax=Colletotrichum chlorophyti TaxID=708187 RepID=A0A1Q8RYD5_9PEZI|nr:hypothetical protein CCHL11_01526 [Colletotrichum chlorophyti]